MARRNDHSREELKHMAIMAAQNIIAHEGFAQFSARRVAREIGYTIGTIYNIFGNHDEFILHINARTLDDLTRFITEQQKQGLDSHGQIRHLALCYVEFATTHSARWNILFEHKLPEGTELPAWYAQKIAHLFALVETPLFALIHNHDTAKSAARTLWASIHGICALGLNGKLDMAGETPVHSLVNGLIDTYLKGLTT